MSLTSCARRGEADKGSEGGPIVYVESSICCKYLGCQILLWGLIVRAYFKVGSF